MRKIRVGVAGLSMGRHHVERFSRDRRCKVAAVCDLDEEKLRAVGERYGIAARFSDFGAMISDGNLDAVVVALPNRLHAPISIKALSAGLHVYCEKPMAMNAREGERMKAAAERAGKNLMIGFNQRFSPVPWTVKRKIDRGELGHIYFGRTVWHRQRGLPGFGGWFSQKEQSGGGPLIDIGVHRLDLALWLMGYPAPVSVSGATYCEIACRRAEKEGKAFNVEDLACGMVKFDNGAALVVEASWALNIHDTHLKTVLCGTKGGLTYAHYRRDGLNLAEVHKEKRGQVVTQEISDPVSRVPTVQGEFLSSIVRERAPLASAEQGIKVMQILDGIYKSARTGREVRYKPGN